MKTTRFLSTILATLLSISAFAQSVDELVDKHLAALGGADKITAVKTLVMERYMSVNGMEIPSKTTLVVGKALRSETSMMGNSMVQVVDGETGTGWMIRPAMMGGTGEAEDMPAQQIRQQTGQLDPFGPLVNYKAKGNTVELVGKEKVDKKDHYRLKITTKGGQVIEQYLDAETFLLTKSVMSGMNGQPAEMLYSDYKAFDGIKFARTTEMTGGPRGPLSFSLDKVKINPTIDEKVFKKGGK